MPAPKKGPRLGSNPSHQALMLSNLALSLFEHERVKTTEAKAKLLRPYAERLITKAKKGDVHNRRQVLSTIEDRAVVHKLFADIAPRFADRNGGYTRILKLGPRNGDNAPMALIELVEDGGATTTTTTGDDSGAAATRRRRLSRPGRRRSGADSNLPQDKPARSKAADAAAAGTPGGDADVVPPGGVVAEGAAADQAAKESAASASSEPVRAGTEHEGDVSQGGGDAGGDPKRANP